MNEDSEIMICDKCHRACCWLGIFMCDESREAGLITTTVRKHRAQNPDEHEDYYMTVYAKTIGEEWLNPEGTTKR